MNSGTRPGCLGQRGLSQLMRAGGRAATGADGDLECWPRRGASTFCVREGEQRAEAPARSEPAFSRLKGFEVKLASEGSQPLTRKRPGGCWVTVGRHEGRSEGIVCSGWRRRCPTRPGFSFSGGASSHFLGYLGKCRF